jgi:membrane-anchored protein YejM (alkaline phosphatase superfamily)
VIVIQLSALPVSFLSTFVLEPAATLGVDLVAVATGLTMLILAFELYTPLPAHLDPRTAGELIEDVSARATRRCC